MTSVTNNKNEHKTSGSPHEIFAAFLKLGLTSFGGPVAHIGYFREDFVVRRRWLDDRTFADLMALCQFLPGPVSSQLGLSIGLLRGGYLGALAAWTGFTLPSAIALILFAYSVMTFQNALDAGWLHGLKTAAVAIVALAVLNMARSLTPDRQRATLAAAAAVLAIAIPTVVGQVGAILMGALVGGFILHGAGRAPHDPLPVSVGPFVSAAASILFWLLLLGLPIAVAAFPNHTLSVIDAFYRSGAMVFGGGHVVLPLLQAEVVPSGWVTQDEFLAGYGATQAVPGPLFTFSAYLGAVMDQQPNGWLGALLCLVMIYLPSVLLIIAVMPYWQRLAGHPGAQSALSGVNAAVVGLLIAALYNPVWLSGVTSTADFALALLAFILLFMWKAPPWLVVVLCAAGGALIAAL